MELRAGLAATGDKVPHDKDPRTAAVRTIHSSKFSTENSLRQICPRLWMSVVLSAIRGIALLKSKAMARAHPCQIHEVWFGRRSVVDPPPHQTRLWRSLPLFPVKKFNGQEMDGRTLKVEIAKSGAPAAKTAGTAAAAGAAVATRTSKWWSELDDAG